MADPYDFRATTALVNVFSVDTGKVATFTAVKSSLADEYLPFFNQMVVMDDESMGGEITVTLTPPTYKDALDLLKSPWMTIGNTVSVRWGYTPNPGHLSDWHHAMLIQPDISFGDQFSIAIKCQGFGWLPAREHSGRVWSSTKPGAVIKTPRQVIDEISKRYNFEVNWNDGFAFGKNARDLLEAKIDIQQTLNDLIFMKSLAARAGCRLYVTCGNKVNVIDGERAITPAVTFVYRQQIDPANNVFPIDSFDSETTAMFLPRTSIAGRFFNPNDNRSKQFKKWTASEQTVKSPAYSGEYVAKPGGEGPTQKSKDGKKIPRRYELDPEQGDSDYVPVVLRQKGLANKLQSQMNSIFNNKSAENHGVSAQIAGVDVPTLLPSTIARVQGVGEYHSVNYRVHHIEHTIGDAFAAHSTKLLPKGFPGGIARFFRMKAPSPHDKDKPTGSMGPNANPVGPGDFSPPGNQGFA